MAELGRGWTGGSSFRPAREVEVRYGHDLLRKESADWPRYIVVTQLNTLIPVGTAINMVTYMKNNSANKVIPATNI